MVAAVGISMAMLRTRRTRFLWMAGIVIGTAVVILAFRRYAWVELATVFAAFVMLSGANRRRYLASIAAVGAVGIITVALTLASPRWGQPPRQPRSHPDPRRERLRDHEPGPHRRHPGRLG